MSIRGLILVATLLSAITLRAAEGWSRNELTLKLVVHRVMNNKGVIGVLVFSSAKGWPKDPSAAFLAVAVPAEADVTQLSIELPPGSYAVVVLHDENKNMKLDRNLFGVPREQWGMSRNPRAKFSSPSFEQARFELSQDDELEIELR